MFLFEERLGTMRARAQSLGMPLFQLADAGRIRIRQIDPAEVAPDEFTNGVRHAIEVEGAIKPALEANWITVAMVEPRGE